MRNSQSGNIFAFLFGAVALFGVLAAVSMQLVTGPLRTMTAVTQKNLVESQLFTNARLVVIHAGIQANNGDADSDSFIEPVEYVPNGAGDCNIALVGGGCLPLTLGASLRDPFGRTYGYCVWDHGTVDNGHADGASAAPYRLSGDTDPTHPVIALISGGRDQTFQTSCLAYDGAGTDGVNRVVGSDDLVFTYTYAEASAASGGLWSIKPTDADTAEIAKDLEVKDSSNNVTVAIDRATGIGDFLGITTDVITAKTGNDLFIEGLTEIEIPTDNGNILSLRNQDAPLFIFNSAYNSNHRLPIFEMLGTNDLGGTRGVAGIIEGNTSSTQWQASDAILQFNAKRGGGASTVGNLFNWMSNDSPVMTLSHEGNLGIGSEATTPSAPLQLQNRLFQYTHAVNLGHARGSYVEFFRAFGLVRAVNLIIQVTERNIKHTSMTFLVNMNYEDYGSASIVRILPISGASRRIINTTGYGSGEIALEYTGGASGIFRLRSVGETDQTGYSPFVISIFSVGAGGEILSSSGSDTANFSYPIYRSSLITQQMGNVGIGEASPRATLDVNGFVRLARYSSEPKACSGADDGAIALTSGARMCVCDDPNGWVEISDRTPCSW